MSCNEYNKLTAATGQRARQSRAVLLASTLIAVLLVGALHSCAGKKPHKSSSKALVKIDNSARTGKREIVRYYEVFGKKYPIYRSASGFEQAGIASWYGPGFHGRTTANGEKYDMRKVSAAHKNLPFGTVLRVENLDNGRIINVRVNDRGPFHEGRVIDLSRKAADKIDMLKKGTARVRLTVVGENKPLAPTRVKKKPVKIARVDIVREWDTENIKPVDVQKPAPQSSPPQAESKVLKREQAIATFGSGGSQQERWIQIGSYAERRHAQIVSDELGILGFSRRGGVRIVEQKDDKGRTLLKVRFGPFSGQQGEQMLKEIRNAGYYDAFLK